MTTLIMLRKVSQDISSYITYVLEPNTLCEDDYKTVLSLNEAVCVDWPLVFDKLDAISLSRDGRCHRFNENITYLLNSWEYSHLVRNCQGDLVYLCYDQDLHRDASALKIQKVWRKANANPNFELCKKRLMREFEEMM